MKTPDLTPREMLLDLGYVNKVLGMKFSTREVKELLERMRFGVDIFKGDKISVFIPAYRADILSEIDLVEDIAISYGYDKFVAEVPGLSTYGASEKFLDFCQQIRELALGFGFQEVMTLVLTNEDNLFGRMNLPAERIVKTEKAVSKEYSVARNWLLPSLLQVLEHNKNREYPQKIFEVGDCVDGQGKNLKKFAGVIAHGKSNFSELKGIVSGMVENLGLFSEMREFSHGSFISGRAGKFDFGFLGEVHPKVLENFGLEVPLAAFEFDLERIWTSRQD